MYGEFVKIHKGHICAGRLDGRGNTCVVIIKKITNYKKKIFKIIVIISKLIETYFR